MIRNYFTSLLLMVALFLGFTKANAQQTYHRCSSMEYLHAQEALNPDLAVQMRQIEQQTQAYVQGHQSGSRAVVTIPVVVHVLYNTAAQNISDALVQAQINQLNLDYARLNADASSTPAAFAAVAANTNVQFCLAQRDPNGNATTGIVHKSTIVGSFTTDDKVKRSSTGGDDAWDATKYLNLWVCNLGGGLLGYAQFPGGAAATDGVVVLSTSVGSVTKPGTASPYNFGRTATHEVGHWLNLYHIWGDDGTACTGTDNVGDTPNQSSENYGCPTYPHTDACTATSPGVMFMNYMDYTDDGCMNTFTAGQAARMNALFATGGARVGLLSSLGCTPPSTSSCGTPAGLSTTLIANTSATLNWGAVSGAASYKVQYRVSGGTTWTAATTTATTYNVTGLTAATTYEWQVQTVCSASSSTFTLSTTFTTTGGTTTTCTDIYESNNTAATAKVPAVNTNLTGFITPSTDVDWFKFTTTAPNTYVKVDLTNLPADYDVALYQSNGTTRLGISQSNGTTNEQIKYSATKAATYYVKVYGYGGANSASSCYTLRVSTGATAFKLADEADAVDSGKPDVTEVQSALKLYPNPAQDNLNVEFISNSSVTARVVVYNIMGQRVLLNETQTTEGVNTLSLNISMLGKGNYIFEIESNGEVQRQRFVIAK